MSFFKFRILLVIMVCALYAGTRTAWAGAWVQADSGQWYYEENQDTLKGWQRIDGNWYCLDSRTGAWIAKPALTAESGCMLLENKLQEQGLYQNEDDELLFQVDYETESRLTISVGYEEKPGVFHRLNMYDIDKKKGTAQPAVGDGEFQLW